MENQYDHLGKPIKKVEQKTVLPIFGTIFIIIGIVLALVGMFLDLTVQGGDYGTETVIGLGKIYLGMCLVVFSIGFFISGVVMCVGGSIKAMLINANK